MELGNMTPHTKNERNWLWPKADGSEEAEVASSGISGRFMRCCRDAIGGWTTEKEETEERKL